MQLDPALPWYGYPLAIVDFETTGVDTSTCLPVSVAAVRFEAGIETDHYYTLINPGAPIPAEASAIHGITDEQVTHAPRWGYLTCCELARVASGALPCAFNASFDRRLLHSLLERRRATMTDALIGELAAYAPLFDAGQRWIDPLIMIRKIDRWIPGKGRHKLIGACKRWGADFDEQDAHNALADVRATGRLLFALLRAGKVNTRTKLGRMLDYIDEYAAEDQARFERFKARKQAEEAAAAERAKQTELVFAAVPHGGGEQLDGVARGGVVGEAAELPGELAGGQVRVVQRGPDDEREELDNGARCH